MIKTTKLTLDNGSFAVDFSKQAKNNSNNELKKNSSCITTSSPININLN
jgi:hypothetical protein